MFSSLPLICLSLLPLVSAAPTRRAGLVGAAYVINNDPSGNSILASNIANDGTLTFGAAISAGGIGLHGNNTNPNAGDPLFSQDAIKVVGGYLYTVNSGSNTIVMFKINPENPSDLTMIGQPVNSGGDFPLSIAVSEWGQVCVLNGGAVSNVSCFKADPANGLTALPDAIRVLPLNQTTPPSGPPGSASDIIFTPSHKLLASGLSESQPGYIAEWAVDPTTGQLSQDFVKNTISSPGMNPFGMTPIPGRDAILSADPAVGYAIWDLTTVSATSNVISVSGQMAICWSTYSASTQSFFLMDPGASEVVEVAVDGSLQSTTVKQYQLATGSGPLDGAVGSVAGKDYLYVLSAAMTSIDVFALPSKGGAEPVQTFNLTTAVNDMTPVSSKNLQGMAIYVVA
ncbi:hypothetical protein FRC04_000500 [Tulasnella sp. 424]|nr:hypothetical protein FRC04_000500 [Tulasnella sp. 424]KAG8973862.1 hypothetical protein FRC05_008082 [Tulasnella sp. 425]